MDPTIDQIKTTSKMKGFLTLIVLTYGLFFIQCSTDKAQPRQNTEKSTTQPTEQIDKKVQKKQIVFFGNSLTAGYGLTEEEAFTAHIQRFVDSLELPYQAVNAGLSGETTAGGDRRIEWVLQQDMDIFFLELGGNDMLRGTDVVTTKNNLRSIIKKVRERHANIPIILAGMLAPPNMGKEYATAFAQIYPTLASEFDLVLIPFFLKEVGGIPAFNQADGIHPTAAGQKIVAKTVWQALYPLLEK